MITNFFVIPIATLVTEGEGIAKDVMEPERLRTSLLLLLPGHDPIYVQPDCRSFSKKRPSGKRKAINSSDVIGGFPCPGELVDVGPVVKEMDLVYWGGCSCLPFRALGTRMLPGVEDVDEVGERAVAKTKRGDLPGD